MKTVGILTFHYVDNYGAVLQTFALRNKINTFDAVNNVNEESFHNTCEKICFFHRKISNLG